ncbi:MAG: hypothetical protein DCF22_09815 [Leptolyngbya sp.]|nr:MAG: hypothetical protein DCF22_09815 [Leptolyngbya sp.]
MKRRVISESDAFNDDQRLVYTVTDDEILVAACKYHCGV